MRLSGRKLQESMHVMGIRFKVRGVQQTGEGGGAREVGTRALNRAVAGDRHRTAGLTYEPTPKGPPGQREGGVSSQHQDVPRTTEAPALIFGNGFAPSSWGTNLEVK